jgi:hypothetical protein
LGSDQSTFTRITEVGADHYFDSSNVSREHLSNAHIAFGFSDSKTHWGGARAVVGLVDRMRNTDKLDILVDLDGFSVPEYHSLFSLRVAPIQISFLGWPATTGQHTHASPSTRVHHYDSHRGWAGSNFHQYIVVDERAAPLSSATHFSEKLISMPHRWASPSQWLREACLRVQH